MKLEAARRRARAAAETDPPALGSRASTRSRSRTLVVGDPQASLDQFLRVLDHHGLLSENGGLVEEAHLVSAGDHFDWGRVDQRTDAARDGLAILAWLASHPADHVTLLLGNHDLARLGELAAFDDARFAEAQREADALYYGSDGTHVQVSPDAEIAFLERYPELPSVETAARDLSTFRRVQRVFVESLLRSRRFSVAVAGDDHVLFCHAGVTRDHLSGLGLPRDRVDARVLAGALNDALDSAVAAWDGASAFEIPGLHVPGSAARGEARGIFVNRPGNLAHERATGAAGAADYAGPPRRRYDPRWLPSGLTQVIGHIRDDKSRRLLGPWVEDRPRGPGELRHLSLEGDRVEYARGLPASSPRPALVFVDGAMRDVEPGAYEIFDADRFGPAPRPS